MAYEIALEKIKGASHMVLRPHACRDIQNNKVADTLERGASLLASQDSARRESTGTPKDLMHIFHVYLACAAPGWLEQSGCMRLFARLGSLRPSGWTRRALSVLYMICICTPGVGSL